MSYYTKQSSTTKELRLSAIQKLGGKCSYKDCEWTNPNVLQIDHLLPSAINSKRMTHYYSWIDILSMENPKEKYQVLCMCHHRLKTIEDLEKIREIKRKLRFLAVPSESVLKENS